MSVPEAIAAAVKGVLPLSPAALQLIACMGAKEHSVSAAARIVETDPALTIQVLRTVNSAAFGLRAPIESVSRAVSFLGDTAVLGIALGISAGGLFKKQMDGYESARGELWAHSLRTAIGARELAKFSADRVSPEIAYTAGMVHDIGKAVLSDWLAGRARDLVAEAQAGNKDFDSEEREHLKTDHAEVGALLLTRWRLPVSLSSAVAFHHNPAQAPEDVKALAYAVHLGDFLAMMGGTGTGADSFLYTLDPGYDAFFAISPGDLEKTILTIEQEFRRTVEAIGD